MSVNLNTFTSFEDVYKKPFRADEHGSFVWSSNGVMTFSGYDHANLPFMKRVCRVLNGEQVFLVRGWGYLTGYGALNLNPNLQPTFRMISSLT